MAFFKNVCGTKTKEYGLNLIGTTSNLFSSAFTTQPHPLLPGGFHGEAGQKFLARRNLRYERKSIV